MNALSEHLLYYLYSLIWYTFLGNQTIHISSNIRSVYVFTEHRRQNREERLHVLARCSHAADRNNFISRCKVQHIFVEYHYIFSFHIFSYMKILYVFYHYVFSFHRFSLMVPLLHVCRGSVMRCPLSHSLMITDTCELQIWYFVKFWHHPHSFSGSGRLTSLLTETSRYYAMSPNHSNVNSQN